MGKTIPWHGKLSLIENKCPHCGAKNEWSDKIITVSELSAQHYKICIKCQGEFVDTYLIDFIDDYFSEDNWKEKEEYLNEKVDHAELFKRLETEGFLLYDENNPNEDSDYYDIPPQSIHFIKGEDNG